MLATPPVCHRLPCVLHSTQIHLCPAPASNAAASCCQAFIFLVSILIAFALSWHVYSSWIGVAVNTGCAALVAGMGVREIVTLQPHFQRHRGQMVVFVGTIVLAYW